MEAQRPLSALPRADMGSAGAVVFQCACEYSRAAFPVVDGQPVLIDFAASIFHRSAYQVDNGSVIERDVAKLSIGSRLCTA